MKRYFYHVVYEYRTNTITLIGSTCFELNSPIESEESLREIAEWIKDHLDLKHLPTITNFLLLRTEETPA